MSNKEKLGLAIVFAVLVAGVLFAVYATSMGYPWPPEVK